MTPLHPDSSWLDAALLRALAQRSDSALRELAPEVAPRVHRLRLLDPERAHALDALLCAASAEEHEPPNNMHEYGRVLRGEPYDALFAALTQDVLRPLGGALFPDFAGAELDRQHAFTVEYGLRADRDLSLHVDDSELTLNLCLAREGGGYPLAFHGLRCPAHRDTPERAEETHWIDHEPGVALLHAGAHRHSVPSSREGARRGLIVWCHAPGRPALAEGACPPWCGAS